MPLGKFKDKIILLLFEWVIHNDYLHSLYSKLK